jgi:hypothetical protein
MHFASKVWGSAARHNGARSIESWFVTNNGPQWVKSGPELRGIDGLLGARSGHHKKSWKAST